LLRACDSGLNLGFKFPETSGDCPFNYTNFNATLIRAVLERVCGKPLQEIIKETLFNPLGMTETGYSTPPEEQRPSSFKKGVV
jgi:CubicO group peptidase (beta-lactamase class C family)